MEELLADEAWRTDAILPYSNRAASSSLLTTNADANSLLVDVKGKGNPLDVAGRTGTVRTGHDFNLRVIRSDESDARLVNERRDPVGLCIAANLTNQGMVRLD